MATRPLRPRPSRSRPLALFLALVLLFTLSPLQSTPTASAFGQLLWWSFDGNSYREFGPNSAITIDQGRMVYTTACVRGTPDTFGFPWTDIYIVPSGSVTFGSKLTDVSGQPNTVQGISSGLFISETIGYTGPGGTIGAGTYAVIYDECQDGYLDPDDGIFDPAFTVTIPEGTVPGLPNLQAIKEKAAKAEEEWKQFHAIMKKWFDAATKADIGNQQSQFWWGMANTGMLIDPRRAVLSQMVSQMKHYKGISADPPDPQFQQVTELEPRTIIDPLGEDPLWAAASSLGSQVSAEERIAEAFLHALERYQGAERVNDGNWALVHAQQIQDYANYLDLQLGRTSSALYDLAARTTSDPRNLELISREMQAFRDRVAAQGFTPEEIREARHLGMRDDQIEQARQELLASDFAFTEAELVAQINALIANNNQMGTALTQLFNEMQPTVLQLQTNPHFTPFAPLADAGGPYTGNEGATITLNGSRSVSPSPITAYEWDLDLDGQFNDAVGVKPSVTLGRSFQGFVGLRVTNQEGHANVAYGPITVNDLNRPPIIGSYTPTPPYQRLEIGAATTFSVSVTDPEGEPVSHSWILDGTEVGTGPNYTWTPTTDQLGPHLLDLLARDQSPLGGVTRHRWQIEVLFPDQDGDGWRQNLDCRDDDPTVNPGQPEIPGNGKDDDCDPSTSDTAALYITPPADQTADEGSASSFQLGAFAAPGAAGPYTVTVDWGDGSTSPPINMAAPGAIADQSHTYADNGDYQVKLSVSAADGASIAATFRIAVANRPPEATLEVPASVAVGSPFTLSLTGAADPSPVDTAAGFAFAFDCGTGAGYSPFGPTSSTACQAATSGGTRVVKAMVRDKDGGTNEYSASLLVVSGPVASFSPQGRGRNLALAESGARVHSVSGQLSTSRTPERMLTFAITDGPWTTPNGQTAGWAKIELAGTTPVLIDRILLMPFSNTERVQDFTVAVSVDSTDDSAFTTVLTATAANNNLLQEFILPQPVLARYIKYSPLSNRGSTCCVSTQAFQALSGQYGDATVTFQNGSTAPEGNLNSYHWDFGDGSTSADASPTHTFPGPGTYTVTLTATDALGASASLALPYTVLAAPSAEIKLNTVNPNEGGTPSFTASASDPDGGLITNYHWSWGDGTAPTNGTTPNASHRFDDNGEYTVTLTVTDDQGQSTSVERVVTIANVRPTAYAGSNQTTPWGLPIASTNATATDPSNTDRATLTCAWTFGDGASHGPGPCADMAYLRPTHTYADPGTYTRTLTVTDKDGASHTSSSTVTVNQRRALVIYQGPRSASADEPIALKARVRDLTTEGQVAGAVVTFQVAGQTLTATTDTSGIATATITSLSLGNYPVQLSLASTVYHSGDTDLDRLLVGVADDSLVTSAASLASTQLRCAASTQVTLQVTGVPPTAQAVPLDVALVIDVSGSMGGANIIAARAAARQFVQIIDRESDSTQDGRIQGSQIAIFPFADSVRDYVNLTWDAATLEQRIQSLTAGGGTAIHAGIDGGRQELSAGAKPGNKPILILLSDGGSSRPLATQAADAAKAAGIELFTIALGTGADTVLMEGLASEPKADHYFFTPSSADLEQIYRTIAASATGPAASDLVVTATVDPAFAVDAASITPAPTSLNGNQITWNLAELKGETRTFSYQVTHRAGVGSLSVHQSATVTYTDTKGRSRSTPFPELVAEVTCPTGLTYTGALSGATGQEVELSALLADEATGEGLPHQELTFELGGLTATAQTDADGHATTSIPLTLAAATYPLTVRFAGSGGYLPTESTVAFTVTDEGDDLPPVTSITPAGTSGQNGWFTSPVTITLSAIDLPSGSAADVATTEYSLDGGTTWQSYAGPFVLTTDGVHILLARSRDLAGNLEAPPVSAQVAIDQNPPVLTTPGSITGAEGATIILEASAVDTTSGLDRMVWDLDGDGEFETSGESVTWTWPDNGSTTIAVRAIDRAGNQADASITVQIENVAPRLTAPADQTAPVDTVTTFALGTFTDPGADAPWIATVDWGDGSPNSSQSYTETGSLGSLEHQYRTPGTYTVTVEVTDKDGATGSSRFTVTVGEIRPCQPLTWRSPLGLDTPAPVHLSDSLLIRFSYGCDSFVRDESVIVTIHDPATQEEVTGWVYEFDIEIDEAAEEYRVLFEPLFYGLNPGQVLRITVFMSGEPVGQSQFQISE